MGEIVAALNRVRWTLVLLAAVVVEVALFAVVAPLYGLPNGATVVLYAVLPICLVGGLAGGLWVARKAGRLFVLHGLLVGVLAALIYSAISWKATLPTIYVVSNYLKVVAGAAGGLVAQRMAGKPVAQPSA
jgi:putative membrane protein (TIGR04086 family)